MNIDRSIVVSICCVTYNHESYIGQCLEGFVIQKTTFPFEILVHDDASTDNTTNIVKEYESKYPHLFRCVYQSENQFKKQNTLINILFPMSRGKYIALCEGDDYWTDSYKLQKQVDILEKDEDTIISFHDFSIVDENNNYLCNGYPQNYKEKLNIKDLIFGHYTKTCTVVFRKDALKNFEIDKISYVDDSVLWIVFLLKGGFAYKLNDNMASYRLHQGSVWSLIKGYSKRLQCIDCQTSILSIINKNPYSYYSHSQLVSLYIQISSDLLDSGKRDEANEYFRKAFNLLFNAKVFNLREALKHITFYYLFIKRLVTLICQQVRFIPKYFRGN